MYKFRSKRKLQEEYEFDKTIKQIAFKIVQVIVQARLGSKIRTYCKPTCYANDYFGVAINDIPNVLTESKRVLDNNLVVHRMPLSVEISLKTSAGNSLVLENWMLGINLNEVGPDSNSAESFYSKVSLLLRSLVSTSRIMPAYKMSRSQDPNFYTIYYRLHMGDYDFSVLGVEQKRFKFGKITCPKGSLYALVNYRTNMFIALESKVLKNKQPTVKLVELPKKTVDFTKPMKVGAFVDPADFREFEDERFTLAENPPCSWLLELAQGKYNSEHMKISKINDAEIIDEEKLSKEAALKSAEEKKLAKQIAKEKEEKFLKPLNLAFHTPNTPLAELTVFFREICRAPSLQSMHLSEIFSDNCTSCQDPEDDISKDLQEHEDSLKTYDRMVTDICQNERV